MPVTFGVIITEKQAHNIITRNKSDEIKHFCTFRKEREAAAKDGSSIKNKMFLEQDDEFLVHEVNHSVRQLCKTIDAFIFVVDSSTSKENGKFINVHGLVK